MQSPHPYEPRDGAATTSAPISNIAYWVPYWAYWAPYRGYWAPYRGYWAPHWAYWVPYWRGSHDRIGTVRENASRGIGGTLRFSLPYPKPDSHLQKPRREST